MKTQIVYVVVSDTSDYYLEQTLLSIYSLRLYHKETRVFLVVDEPTNNSITERRAEIRSYADEIICIKVPSEYTKVQSSRFLKTSLREFIIGDFLFIDSDTLITGKLDEIENLECDIACVADKHIPIKRHPMKSMILSRAKILDSILDEESVYFNSGVIYCRDNQKVHNFYKEWHKQWKQSAAKNVNADQPALAKVNSIYNIVTELNGIWNCQLTDNGLKYLMDAKIIHYFASTSDGHIISPYRFYQDEIYEEIKKTGFIPDRIKDIIKDPKREFDDLCRIVSVNDFIYLDSSIHKLYLKHRKTFKLFEVVAKKMLQMDRAVKKLNKGIL